MNKLETAYREYLFLALNCGKVKEYEYIPQSDRTFELAHRCTYTPDFRVILQDGSVQFHEVKGYMRDDAAVKLKVAARMYPKYDFYLVKRDKRKGWTIRKVPK